MDIRELKFTEEEAEIHGMQVDIIRSDGRRMCRLSIFEHGGEKHPKGIVDVRSAKGQTLEAQVWDHGRPLVRKTFDELIHTVSVTVHGEEAQQENKDEASGNSHTIWDLAPDADSPL
jgi:hypothetical protein